jgi:2-amino-4-hydroxy-6-hydroxymethyldihydropteridine diphosphokinase
LSTRRTERALIGLGGNLGDVAANMHAALALIDADIHCRVEAVSSFWRTPPWGNIDQPDFINACACVSTSLAPRDFLALCLTSEVSLRRIRNERWGPRTIDIDILFFGERVIAEDGLTVPHPRIGERAFVLVPLAEIAPEIMLEGMTIADRAAKADRSGMERLDA